jgi:phosphoglycolate phosphatase
MGKPNTSVYDYIRSKFKIDPKRTLMTGNSLIFDIRFGNRHGFDTMLVLTGTHSLQDVEKYASEGKMIFVPKMYAYSLKSLLVNNEEAQEENLKNFINNDA